MKFNLLFLLAMLMACRNEPSPADPGDDHLIQMMAVNDQQLETPKPGEWLYQYKEAGQTLEQYKSSAPIRPTASKKTIYLQPIGNFSKDQLWVISENASYLQLFYQLPAVILPVLSDSIIPDHARRINSNGIEQLLATYIIDSFLIKNKPNDAIGYMAITEKDLYPEPSWNFVFGLASYEKQTGVSSIFRYSKKIQDSTDRRICLERLIKTSSHEIGHMFSLLHCIHADCVMNGSNSLAESDYRTSRLCSECLSKLYWNTHLPVRKRLLLLKDFFIRTKLDRCYNDIRPDILALEKNQQSIK